MTEQTKYDRIFLHNNGTWWSPDRYDDSDVEYIRADLVAEQLAAKDAALDRIANMKNRDGIEIDMHREELRAIARTALKED